MKKIKLPRKQKKAFIKKFGRNAYYNDYSKKGEFSIIDEYRNLPRKTPAYVWYPTMSLYEVIENLEK